MSDAKPITAEIDGRPCLVERIRLDDLADWRDQHGLVATGTIGRDRDGWPILVYEKKGSEQ